MIKRFFISLFIASILLLTACSGLPQPAGPEGTSLPDEPSEAPVASLTPSATFTLTAEPLPSKPMISVSVDTNCRTGQGGDFDYLGALLVGETTEVLARDTSERYWYIPNPDGPGFCWVWGEYATIIGDTSPLPVYTPEPTPTPMPAFSYVFDDIVQCVTMYSIKLLVTNTGEVTWESFRLYSENTTLNITDTWKDNRFADCEACGCDTPENSISPGESNYIGSIASFMNHYPHGESFYTEVKLCTQDGLMGTCLTQELTFTVP